jgi:hypothetical protein
MQLKSLKLWQPVSNIIIPPAGYDDKRVALFFYGENNQFFETYNILNIPKTAVRLYYLPTIYKPIKSWMTPKYKVIVKNYKLIPKWGLLGDYNDFEDHNFYFDGTIYPTQLDLKYKFKKYNSTTALNLYTNYLQTLGGVDPNKFHRILLYSVNMDKPLNSGIFQKKFYPIFRLLMNSFKEGDLNSLPFDKIIMFKYSKNEGGTYTKLFDNTSKPSTSITNTSKP